MWFIDFLFAILIIYIFGYLLFRYVFPCLLKLWFKRLANQMNPDFDKKQNTKKTKKQKQGDINIDYIPEEKKSDTDIDKGEYIDYEEIE